MTQRNSRSRSSRNKSAEAGYALPLALVCLMGACAAEPADAGAELGDKSTPPPSCSSDCNAVFDGGLVSAVVAIKEAMREGEAPADEVVEIGSHRIRSTKGELVLGTHSYFESNADVFVPLAREWLSRPGVAKPTSRPEGREGVLTAELRYSRDFSFVYEFLQPWLDCLALAYERAQGERVTLRSPPQLVANDANPSTHTHEQGAFFANVLLQGADEAGVRSTDQVLIADKFYTYLARGTVRHRGPDPSPELLVDRMFTVAFWQTLPAPE